MTTTKPMTFIAKLSRSRYGNNPQPTILPRAAGVAGHPDSGAHHRAIMAGLYRVAAALEEGSAGEGWIVVVEQSQDVHLELADATEAEAARGMALVERVAREATS